MSRLEGPQKGHFRNSLSVYCQWIDHTVSIARSRRLRAHAPPHRTFYAPPHPRDDVDGLSGVLAALPVVRRRLVGERDPRLKPPRQRHRAYLVPPISNGCEGWTIAAGEPACGNLRLTRSQPHGETGPRCPYGAFRTPRPFSAATHAHARSLWPAAARAGLSHTSGVGTAGEQRGNVGMSGARFRLAVAWLRVPLRAEQHVFGAFCLLLPAVSPRRGNVRAGPACTPNDHMTPVNNP